MGFHLLFNPLLFSTDFHENHTTRLDRRSFSISFWISCFVYISFFFGISFRIFNLIAKLTNAFIANSTFRVIFCLLEKFKCFKQIAKRAVSGSNPTCELGIVIQFAEAFYTAKQIHFRFQKEQNSLSRRRSKRPKRIFSSLRWMLEREAGRRKSWALHT